MKKDTNLCDRIIKILNDSDEPLYASAVKEILEERMGSLSQQKLTDLVNELESKGFIQKSIREEVDRRKKLLILTDSGLTYAHKLQEESIEWKYDDFFMNLFPIPSNLGYYSGSLLYYYVRSESFIQNSLKELHDGYLRDPWGKIAVIHGRSNSGKSSFLNFLLEINKYGNNEFRKQALWPIMDKSVIKYLHVLKSRQKIIYLRLDQFKNEEQLVKYLNQRLKAETLIGGEYFKEELPSDASINTVLERLTNFLKFSDSNKETQEERSYYENRVANRFLIVLDQFENILTYKAQKNVLKLLLQLEELVCSSQFLSLIVSIRSETKAILEEWLYHENYSWMKNKTVILVPQFSQKDLITLFKGLTQQEGAFNELVAIEIENSNELSQLIIEAIRQEDGETILGIELQMILQHIFSKEKIRKRETVVVNHRNYSKKELAEVIERWKKENIINRLIDVNSLEYSLLKRFYIRSRGNKRVPVEYNDLSSLIDQRSNKQDLDKALENLVQDGIIELINVNKLVIKHGIWYILRHDYLLQEINRAMPDIEKKSKNYRELWRSHLFLDKLPPKETFSELLNNIDLIPEISEEAQFLNCMMIYTDHIEFKNVPLMVLKNILQVYNSDNYSLSEWNHLIERIIQNGSQKIIIGFITSNEFRQGVLRKIFTRNLKKEYLEDIIKFLSLVKGVSEEVTKEFIRIIVELIEINTSMTVETQWELCIRLLRMQENLGHYLFYKINWKHVLRKVENKDIQILTDVFRKKVDVLGKSSDDTTLKNIILSLENHLIQSIQWQEIITTESDYYTARSLINSIWQDRREQRIEEIESLAWNKICLKAFDENPHKFLSLYIPSTIIRSKNFAKIHWIERLINKGRLDYIVRFLGRIRGAWASSLFNEMLEELVERFEDLKQILVKSPKKEVEEIRKKYTEAAIPNQKRMLTQLDSQDWGFVGKNRYENSIFRILTGMGFNQVSIEDYLNTKRSSYQRDFGANINQLISLMLDITIDTQILQNKLASSMTANEDDWLYILEFYNYLDEENHRFDPYYATEGEIDLKLEYSFRFSHFFGLLILLEIIESNFMINLSSEISALVIENLFSCLKFIISCKSVVPTREEEKKSPFRVYGVNDLVKTLIEVTKKINLTTLGLEKWISNLTRFDFIYTLSFERLENDLPFLLTRFFDLLYNIDPEKADKFADKWLKDKYSLELHYTKEQSTFKKDLSDQAHIFVEDRLNGQDCEVSALFKLTFPKAINDIPVIKNLEDLHKAKLHSVFRFMNQSELIEMLFSDEWLEKIDWKRILNSKYTLSTFKDWIISYFWRNIPEKALMSIIDDSIALTLFNTCLREKNPLLGLQDLYVTLKHGPKKETILSKIINSVSQLPNFQNFPFVDNFKQLEADDTIDILGLIYTKMDKNLGKKLIDDPEIINDIKEKMSKRELHNLLNSWNYLTERMVETLPEYSSIITEKIFPLEWKGSKLTLIDRYIGFDQIKEILVDVSNFHQIITDELPSLIESNQANRYSFEKICHNIGILGLLDETRAITLIENVRWDNHFNIEQSYYGLDYTIRIIVENWTENMIKAMQSAKNWRKVQLKPTNTSIAISELHNFLRKDRNENEQVWKIKIDLLISIPSFWEIDWIEEMNGLLNFDIWADRKRIFFLLVEIFTDHPENPHVQKLFDKDRFIKIRWDLAFLLESNEEGIMSIAEFLERMAYVSQETTNRIKELYFNS